MVFNQIITATKFDNLNEVVFSQHSLKLVLEPRQCSRSRPITCRVISVSTAGLYLTQAAFFKQT